MIVLCSAGPVLFHAFAQSVTVGRRSPAAAVASAAHEKPATAASVATAYTAPDRPNRGNTAALYNAPEYHRCVLSRRRWLTVVVAFIAAGLCIFLANAIAARSPA